MKRHNLHIFIDRTLSGNIWRQSIVFLILIVCSLFSFWLLGQLFGIPFHRDQEHNGYGNVWNLIYFFTDTGSLPSATDENRWFTYVIGFIGSVLLGGVLISTLSNIFERRVEQIEKGRVRYRLHEHVIIAGYNQATLGLIRHVSKMPNYADSPIVLLTNHDAERVRLALASNLPEAVSAKVVVYHGYRGDPDEVQKLYPDLARILYMLGDLDECDSDSIHMDCMKWVARICKSKRRDKLLCHVIFNNPATVTAFQRADLTAEIKESCEFYPLVYHEIIATEVLNGSSTDEIRNKQRPPEAEASTETEYNNRRVLPPLDREVIDAESRKFVHLILSGMDDMAVTLAIQTALTMHFPNFESEKTRITFIDPEADKKYLRFRARFEALMYVADSFSMDIERDTVFHENPKHPDFAYLGDFVDVQFFFLKSAVDDVRTRKLIEEWVTDPAALVTIAICHEQNEKAVESGIYLPRMVFERRIPVWIYQKESAAIIESLSIAKSSSNGARLNPLNNLFPFGRVKQDFNPQNVTLEWAKRIHFVYSSFFESGLLPDALPAPDEWRDKWLKQWNDLIIAKQWSNIYHANSIPVKLRSIRYKYGSGDAIPEDLVEILSQVEHNRWVVEELIMGYRPATKTERHAISLDPTLKKQYRSSFIHVDLCGYKDLLKDEKGNDVREYDRILIRKIPLIIQES